MAEQGISSVPLRDIAIAAGQRNKVAVQYHFGSRENLVRAITMHRAEVSEHRRSELLAELLREGRSPTMRDVVHTFMQSLACHLEPDNHYLAFLSRYAVARGDFYGLDGMQIGSSIRTLMAILGQLLPDHPRALLDERWMVMMTSGVHTLARYQTAQKAGSLDEPISAMLDDLVSVFSAGLQAPVGTADRR